ncbi:hypothetical protein L210DRAFT_3656687 [Boletus edulis BED1]|uniref:Uncharacterized protein n=1 Tax=Boletus edulis BED1 TaxID=1328754 RepID=A0AAD4G612_BOLED|nr:hypothetical protein L210DRAFT_3656687 [Boletus edulis BED1]
MGDGATAGPSSLPELSDIIPMVVKRSSGDREIAGPSAPLMKLLYPFKRKAQVPRGPQASLGYDILDARYNSLKYKRRYLSIIYYQIARLGYFSPNEVQKSIDWLAANPNDTTMSYILAATLAAFDPAEPHPFTGNVRKNLATDKGTIVQAPPPPRSPQPRSQNRVEAFVRQELVPASKPDASLASRIFNEIESIGTTVTQAQIARQNAQSNTIPPSGPGSQPSLGYDILDARYDSLKYERRYLSIVYYQTARLGYFSPNEVQKSIDWLAANPNDTTTSYILGTRCHPRSILLGRTSFLPWKSKLHHHLGLLSREVETEELRAVYHFMKSMTALHSFTTSWESILPIWSSTAQSRRSQPDATVSELSLLLQSGKNLA